MNKLLKLLPIIFLSLSTLLKANPNNIDAKTLILMDHNSSKIIFEKDPDLEIYPASMTKIMTSIIVFDLLQQNKISLDDKVVISDTAWHMSQSGFSSMFIMPNDEVSIEDLLRGIIVVSGNDACVAIAEGVAGSEENFVEMMNEKASEIGMMNTNFSNSSGITDPNNYSTARDIALMSQYLIKNYPEYYPLYAEKEFTWDRTGGDPIKQNNRNGLLYRNIGADGIKTGYLDAEKYSLASTIKRGERRLISVGSGFKTKNFRTKESIKLLGWGFRHTETFEISKKGETFFDIRTWLGEKDTVKGVTKEDFYVTINKKDLRNFKVFLEYNGPIKAPIEKDQQIASLKVSTKDEVMLDIPIYSSEKIKKINFFKSLFTSLNYMIWGDV
tara:strand:+ start:715 stop:1869 length:1155 start_codon:yes stop_codon:yes gene_type:complete